MGSAGIIIINLIIIILGGLPALASTMVLPAESPLEWVSAMSVHPSLGAGVVVPWERGSSRNVGSQDRGKIQEGIEAIGNSHVFNLAGFTEWCPFR